MGSRARALTITIGGTNDLPTIDASTNPLPIGEQLGDSSAQDIAPTTGTINSPIKTSATPPSPS